jgi:hypothetical protein
LYAQLLGRIGKVLDMIQSTSLQSYPNLIVRWHDGVRTREIVIRGYDPRRGGENWVVTVKLFCEFVIRVTLV